MKNLRFQLSAFNFPLLGICQPTSTPPRGATCSSHAAPRFIFSFLLSAFCFQLSASTVTWSPQDITGSTLAVRLTIQPTNTVLNNGTSLGIGPAKTYPATTNQTTLAPGNYTVSSPDVPYRLPFLIAVPDDSATYNITALRSPPVTYTYTNALVRPSYQIRVSTNLTAVTNLPGTFNEYLTLSASAAGGSGTFDYLALSNRPAIYLTNGFYTNITYSGVSGWNGKTLPDSTAYLQAAINSAANTNGIATVYFGAGIYRITNNLIVPPKVNIVGRGQLHDGRGGHDSTTNGWTVIWVDNTNSSGLIFVDSAYSHAELHNIEVCGYTNPLAPMSEYTTAPAANLANGVGVVIASGTNFNWSGGFYDNHVGIHGFRVGMWCQQNNVIHDYLDMAGNDVGFVAWADFTTTIYRTGSYSGLLTNVFNLWNATAWGTPSANSDNQIFNVPNGGFRAGQVEYLIANGFGYTINQEGEQKLTMYGIFSSAQVAVRGLLAEFNDNFTNDIFNGTVPSQQYYGARPLIKVYYNTDLILENCRFTTVANSSWFTNVCVVDSTEGQWSGVASGISGVPAWLGGDRFMLAAVHNGIASYPQTDAYNCFFYDAATGRYKPAADFNSATAGQIEYNSSGDVITKSNSLYGRITLQQLWQQPDYLTVTHSLNGGRLGSSLGLSRILLSDPVNLSTYASGYTTPPPRNYTVDNLTVASNLTANLANATNASPALATNSATATDGQVLVKRGNNLRLETVSGGSTTNFDSITVTNGMALGGSTWSQDTNILICIDTNNIGAGGVYRLTDAGFEGLWHKGSGENNYTIDDGSYSQDSGTFLTPTLVFTNIIQGAVGVGVYVCTDGSEKTLTTRYADRIKTDYVDGIINGVKKYVVLLTQYAPATFTAAPLRIGERYAITTFEAGDDFSNVGGDNIEGHSFIATGTTPAVWTNGSVLDSDGAPVATILENTLGGVPVYSRDAAGTFTITLSGGFTTQKTVCFIQPVGIDLGGVSVAPTGDGNTISMSTMEAGTLNSVDGMLVGLSFEIRVYP